MREKLKAFYEEHEDLCAAIGGTVTGMVIGFVVITPMMLIWKKMGLYNNN